jgi:uncharacterized membrane protein YgcG
MKKLLIIVMVFSLLLMPLGVYAQLDQKSATPPVSQSLVPEGDFALKLVAALKLGTPGGEAQAEDMLSSAGIAPKNGWIADYPVTPIIVGELQSAVVAAADAQRLPMAKDDALKAFQDVTTESGLAVVPSDPSQYAGTQPQPDPTVINNYYYEEGPPVVTYYPPPWDYDYLYAWVPYPFWCSGFFFPGFFVLHDFHRSIFVGHHHHFITNHLIDPRTHTVLRVDPTTRAMGKHANASLTRPQEFRSTDSRRAATSIFNRRFERTATTRGAEGTISRGTTGKTMNQVGDTGRQNEMNFRQAQSGSFNTPNVTHERSFRAPTAAGRSFGSSENLGRSFSPPSRSFSAPSRGSTFSCTNCHGGSSSFARSSGGSNSRSFSSGGVSHGGGHFGGGGRR